MNYFQFEFELKGKEEQEQLIAMLGINGFEGFEEQDDTSLDAFIPAHQFDEPVFSLIVDKFPFIAYTKTIVENINWNKQWEENFEPVIIGKFAGIRAGFHAPLLNLAHEIIITPKMSFGTGHHATTYLMVEQMQHINFMGRSILDFGTGTGILAILAEKLGASGVMAIDYDEWSINNTLENITLNNCTQIKTLQADNINHIGQFDVVLANINLNVLTENTAAIASACKPGASVLLSGFLKENEAQMINALEPAGFTNIRGFQKGDWIALAMNFTPAV